MIIFEPIVLVGLFVTAFLLGYVARPPHAHRPRRSLFTISTIIVLAAIAAWLSYGKLWEFVPA